MHPRVHAQRSALAHNSIIEESAKLIDLLGLDASLMVALARPVKADPPIRVLFQQEAVAAILAAVAEVIAARPGPDPEVVPNPDPEAKPKRSRGK